MSTQMTLFEEETVTIVCEHCGAVFILSQKSAQNFWEVHGCYRGRDKK